MHVIAVNGFLPAAVLQKIVNIITNQETLHWLALLLEGRQVVSNGYSLVEVKKDRNFVTDGKVLAVIVLTNFMKHHFAVLVAVNAAKDLKLFILGD